MTAVRRTTPLLLALCLAATPRPVAVRALDGSVELDLPAGWLRTENVARGDRTVKLTCRHPRADAYLAVVAEPCRSADVSLDDYAAAVAERMAAQLGSSTRTPWTTVKVGDRDGRRCELTGTVGTLAVGYVVTVVRTDTGFVQVVGWTAAGQLAANRTLLAEAADGLR